MALKFDRAATDAAWSEWLRDRSADSRNRLVDLYRPLCAVIAWKMAGKVRSCAMLDVEDLDAVGVIALMRAIAAFDPGVGVLFTTYAGRRIRGAMLDEMRSQDWVPRTVRDALRGTDERPAEIGLLDRPDLVEALCESDHLEDHERSFRLLRSLTSEQRHVVTMRADGASWGEIAKELGVGLATAKKLLQDAAERIRVEARSGGRPLSDQPY